MSLVKSNKQKVMWDGFLRIYDRILHFAFCILPILPEAKYG